MTFSVMDVAVEMFVAGGWTDISTDVMVRAGVQITRGRQDEAGTVAPSTCTLMLDNRSGKYSPRNPVSAYYGSLKRNTPLRFAIRTAKDNFGRTVSNSWGSADVGGAWTVVGVGGVTAADWNVAGGVGTMAVPTAGGYRFSYLTGQLYRDVEVATTVSVPFANVTGDDIDLCIIALSGLTNTDYLKVSLKVTTAEVVSMSISHYDGTVYVPDTPVAGLTFTGQPLRVRAQLDGQTIRGKVWSAANPEPYAWNVEAGASALVSRLARRAPGWVGVRSGLNASNTNAPAVFSYDNFEVRSNRFAGEVSNWPSTWDLNGEDVSTQITASGILRRLGQGEAPQKSTYLRGNQTISPAHLAYWPVEDQDGSTSIASGIGGAPMTITNGAPDFEGNTNFAGSRPIAVVKNSRWTSPTIAGAATGQIQVMFLLSVPSGGEVDQTAILQIQTTGTAVFWDVVYATTGDLFLKAYDAQRNLIFTGTTFNTNVDGKDWLISIELTQVGGNVDCAIARYEIGAEGGFVGGSTFAGATLGSVRGVTVSQYTQVTSSAIGHIAVRNSITSIFTLLAQLQSYSGEAARSRIERVCAENAVPFGYISDGRVSPTALGAQGLDTFTSVIGEAAEADMGSLYESRSVLSLGYRVRSGLYNLPATLALDYAADLPPEFSPVDDDQDIRNDVTVTRKQGTSFQAVQTTGPLAVTTPGDSGGVGRYDDAVTLNLAADTQVPYAAAWLVHKGTVDEARYPQIQVHRAYSGSYADQKSIDLLSVDVDSRITIDNPRPGLPPDQVSQLVLGYTEVLDGVEHTFTFNGTPESPYEVVRLDDTARGKIDTITSTLAKPATATDTKLLVSDGTGPGWTTNPAKMPIPLQIAGERVSATAIAAAGPTFVAAGVAATGNNSSVVAAHPAGLQVGDLKLIFTSIRNSGTGFVAFPAGWEQIFGAGNFAVLWRYHQTGDAAPTVTFVNGVANADTIVQMAAFRGCSATKLIDQALLNASAQNIAYPACPIPKNNALVLYLGWKQDDWTSVATLAGATEIGEPSSTAGDDSAMVWDYLIQTNKADIPAGSFVVTGGASAISRGAVVVLDGNVQAMTVTRSVNGVVKAQSAGAQVKLARPATLAL